MIQQFVKQWEANKHKLETHFKVYPPKEYTDIVKALFRLIITTVYKSESDNDQYGIDIDALTLLNHGSFCGTLIYIIPLKTYYPDRGEYIVTSVDYGSCSHCDTFERVMQDFYYEKTEVLTKKQLEGLMTLALHIVQETKIGL